MTGSSSTLGAGALLLALTVGGCASPKDVVATPSTAELPPSPYSQPPAARTIDALHEPDREFVARMIEMNAAGAVFGQLGMTKASLPWVKNVGREVLDTATRRNDHLREISRRANAIVLPIGRIAPEHEATLARLEALTDGDFDREYVHSIFELQQETLRSYSEEAARGTDPAIREFAAGTVPSIESRIRWTQTEIGRF